MENNPSNRKYFNSYGEVDLREFGRVVNTVTWLEFMASPKLWAMLPSIPPKGHLLTLLDEFLPYAHSSRYYAHVADGETQADTSQRGPLATQLRALIAAWDPPEVTAEIRQTACRLLIANGSKEPPGGAEAFSPDADFPYDKMILGPDGFNEE